MKRILNSLLDLLFPKICNGCQGVLTAQEQIICTTCRHQAPLAGFHKTKADTLKKYSTAERLSKRQLLF